MNEFELEGEVREAVGTSAMRRLRRTGMTPGVIYGAGKDTVPLAVRSNVLKKQIENEAFFSHILTVKVNGKSEQAVIKEMQRHPVTADVTHLDLLRIVATETIEMRVPLHFKNEDSCPGAKAGGVVSHLMIEVEISCLPRDLPEYIEVDMSGLEIGDAIHLSELKIPEGVELLTLVRDPEQDHTVVSVQVPAKPEEEEPLEGEEAPEAVAAAGEEPEAGGETGSGEEESD